MRRVVITYLVESGNKTPEGNTIMTGIWANPGKTGVKGPDVQIFDANTGESLNGVVEVKMSVTGPHGLTGSIRSLVMTKNPEAGKEVTGADGKKMKSPAYVPIMDSRQNIAMTEEDCIVVELAPMNEELMKKIQGIREVPVKLADDLKEKMAEAAEEADLTKGEK
jgi:hypothetical protein